MLYLKARFMILILACILCIALPVAGINEDDFIIDEPEIHELFAAQYRYYQSKSAGSISIQNNTDKTLSADVSVTMPECTFKALADRVDLPTGKKTQIKLKIDFCMDKLPTEGKAQELDAKVEVNIYDGKERLFQRRLSTRFQLHSLNIIPDGPPEVVAVFIDPDDRSVVGCAKGIRSESLSDNPETAKKLFKLFQKKVKICVDQTDKTTWYPKEMLNTGIGSSYGCAFLYAALLESSNIPVALMVSDKYILILFKRQGQVDEDQQEEIVSWKGGSWTPVDVRMLEATFSKARLAGMQAYKDLNREGKVKPFTLREAWKQYKPARPVSSPLVKEIQLGITSAHLGKLQKAEQIFSEHINDDNVDIAAAALNNLGKISLRRDKIGEAVQHYQSAKEIDPSDSAIYLNLGIAYAIKNKDKEAAAMFDHAFRELGSYAQMCYALGMSSDSQDHKEVSDLLREAEGRSLKKRVRPMGSRAALDNKQLPLYWKRH